MAPSNATTPLEASQTRELFQITENLSTCQAMKMQLQSRLGSDAAEFFYFACMDTLSVVREQESSSFENNLLLNRKSSSVPSTCLSKLDIIVRTKEETWNPQDPEQVSTWIPNPRFNNDEAFTQKTFGAMADCFASDSSIVQRVQKKHQMLSKLSEGGMNSIMPTFTKTLRDLKEHNGGIKNSSSNEETKKLFDTFNKEAQQRFISCMKAQKNTIPAKNEEFSVAVATDRCSATSFENFFKGMILSCHKSVSSCVEQSRMKKNLESENVFGVLACVTDLQHITQEGCAKFAVEHIDELSRTSLD
ncbi:predicted protein [Naegleria gruberi]|uniref:Predicted protein n=1 Tax=Naegleria gruberi TaxID=5762 RepID=D2VBE4_NAEGR|nr:uncharacterized protein NAEGRDRAFT_66185 [Naegleria gruberi]EFC45894.1 predicted protein [Naegleria gruberi]|eukprot:XP_002678638.1 predicted protein [Naegleria gruberi strain NEG-M]